MRDITSARFELDGLRLRLVEAWAETPFPTEKIAVLNKKLVAVLASAGFAGLPTGRRPLVEATPEVIEARKEKARLRSRAYWAAYRARKAALAET